MAQLKIKATNEIIALEKWSLSSNIEQFVWSFNADLPTKDALALLIPPANLGQNYIEVVFTLGNQAWQLIIEEESSHDTNFSYSITGKSKAVVLAEPYAKVITKTWLNTDALAICQELCDAKGIVLDWTIINWNIPKFIADKRYPIDIISELVKDIGAKLQSLPDGTLKVLYFPAVGPADLANQTAAHSFDTTRNIFDRAEKFINRPNFDCIWVGNDSTLLDAPTASIEEIGVNDSRILSVYVNPPIAHDVLNLQVVGNASLSYLGSDTKRQIDDIMIDGGEGRLSKAFGSLVNVKWHQREIGALTIASNGRVSCDKGDTGLATITYNTPYLKYSLARAGNIAKTLLVSDELQRPVLTTGDNPALPITVRTLSTAEQFAIRANAELWTQMDTKEYDLTVAYTGDAVQCGRVAQVNIKREQLGFKCWVKSVAINSGDEISQAVTLERPCF